MLKRRGAPLPLGLTKRRTGLDIPPKILPKSPLNFLAFHPPPSLPMPLNPLQFPQYRSNQAENRRPQALPQTLGERLGSLAGSPRESPHQAAGREAPLSRARAARPASPAVCWLLWKLQLERSMCVADKVEYGLSMDPCGRVQDLGPAKRLLGCWVESRQGDVEASVVSSGRRPQPSRAGLTPPFAVPPSRRLASGGGGLGHSPARLHRLSAIRL